MVQYGYDTDTIVQYHQRAAGDLHMHAVAQSLSLEWCEVFAVLHIMSP